MQRDVSLNQDLVSGLARQVFEGTNVNLRGLHFGSQGEQNYYGSMIRPHFIDNSALQRQAYSFPGSVQILFDSGPTANSITPPLIELPFFMLSPNRQESDRHLTNAVAWMAFSREVLKDSRPMTDWERKATADFFWSEFD
jgi:hypothetical protein